MSPKELQELKNIQERQAKIELAISDVIDQLDAMLLPYEMGDSACEPDRGGATDEAEEAELLRKSKLLAKVLADAVQPFVDAGLKAVHIDWAKSCGHAMVRLGDLPAQRLSRKLGLILWALSTPSESADGLVPFKDCDEIIAFFRKRTKETLNQHAVVNLIHRLKTALPHASLVQARDGDHPRTYRIVLRLDGELIVTGWSSPLDHGAM